MDMEASRRLNEIVKSMPPNPMVETVKENWASAFYARIDEWIKKFDASIDETQEVGVRLVSFGESVSFHLESMAYWNPSLISFSGTMENGKRVELVQHVSQISILLMALPRAEPDKPKRPFGFQTSAQAPGPSGA